MIRNFICYIIDIDFCLGKCVIYIRFENRGCDWLKCWDDV